MTQESVTAVRSAWGLGAVPGLLLCGALLGCGLVPARKADYYANSKKVSTRTTPPEKRDYSVPADEKSENETPSAEPPPPAYRRAARVWALVVGISEYRKGASIPYAASDARAFADVLGQLGWGSDSIRLLVDGEATRTAVRESTVDFLSSVGEEDTVVLFWSGKAVPDTAGSGTPFLMCHESSPTILRTGFPLASLFDAVVATGARDVLVFLDTCHGGKRSDAEGGPRCLGAGPFLDHLLERPAPGAHTFVAIGTSLDREPEKKAGWGHGAFSRCVLEALAGDADGLGSDGVDDDVVTIGELRSYLDQRMPEMTRVSIGVGRSPLIHIARDDEVLRQLTLSVE